MISICIPTYNRINDLKKCLDSIFNGFKNYPYEIIIADGGSTDGTIDYLKNLDEVKLIEQGKLTGAVKAFNLCFKAAKGDFILTVTDDFIVNADVIIKTCELMKKDKQIGLVGPKLQETKYGKLHNIHLPVKPYWILSPKIFFFKTSVIKEIGYFDEKFRTYYIDLDFPLMILNLGYTIAVTRDVGLVHFRIHDEEVNRAKKINTNKSLENKEVMYLQKKWEPLQIKIEEYLEKSDIKKQKALLFKKLFSMMYYAEWLRPFIITYNKMAMKLFDWLLEQAIIFRDHRYKNHKKLFLAQKLPSEVISHSKNF